MSDESPELSRSLRAEIARLNDELVRTRTESKTRRIKLREAEAERDTLKADLTAAAAQRDEFRQRLEAAPTEQQKTIAELQGKIRERTHRDAFDRLARGAGVKDEALDAAWKLAGYTPEGDAPDEAKIGELLAAAKTTQDFLFKSPTPAADAATNGATPRPERLVPGPGAQRGNSTGDGGGATVSRKQLADTKWMFAHQDEAALAVKEGRLVD